MIRTVLFDLDGTLINTNNLILASFQYTLDRYFPGKYTKKDLIPFIGEPLELSFDHVDPAQRDEMIEVYRAHNSKFHDRLVTEFPHVHETLEKLSSEGCKMGVVSTKKRDMVNRGLEFTHIAGYFDTVVTSDDVARLKPDPEPVEKAMVQLAAQPESTLMVGDSPSDILAGSGAHVRTAAVGWSMKGRSVLEKLHPDYLIDSMNDLLKLVRTADSATL
ncbi:pyrophosphatase PpaX [Sporolactobacillus shoreae]|uniref:Pyrophosphatase PpaX n=1 Tax=Sporolactobacillus shoreae TaxID=1465501 RepID=A0A4Z0GKL2_9BACL|nr:pyrophosphatase PpaX [Sporolactobacillus shoreae]TGA97381.1 pyrophosphatase PpaX [Sporolactobacillus shoreae]